VADVCTLLGAVKFTSQSVAFVSQHEWMTQSRVDALTSSCANVVIFQVRAAESANQSSECSNGGCCR